MHWSEFVQKYKHLPKISYSELLEKYETYAIKKQKIEEAFKVEYGVIVNVNRSEYIFGEDKNIIHY
jgi:hypothetical protein